MADLQKFIDLLQANNYMILEYFSLINSYCIFVKVIHTLSGCILFISVSRNFKLLINDDRINHYLLVKEDMPNKEPSSQQLSEYYPYIQPIIEEEEVIDDISTKLKHSYKQPITLPRQSSMEYVEQMKRLRYCFKLLDIKLLLQTDQHIIRLTTDNLISVYKIENYPKTKLHTFHTVVSLEHFYAKIDVINTTVEEIENEFYAILDINQEKHNQYLNTNYIEYFIKNNDNLLSTKKRNHEAYKEIANVLTQVQEKEKQLVEKLEKIQESSNGHNFFREADLVKQKNEIEKNIRKMRETKNQILEKLLGLDSKIKNMYLITDQLGFNLTIAFNELRSELYKMLL